MLLAVGVVRVEAADVVQSGLLLVAFGDFGECSCCGLMNIAEEKINIWKNDFAMMPCS